MEYKRYIDFFGNQNQEMIIGPMDYATTISHIRKNAAILKKIANIIPVKTY